MQLFGQDPGGRGRGILVQADPRTVPVLPVQGPDKVPAVTESPRPRCLDRIVRQRVQRAVQLVADLRGGMGPHGSTVGDGVDPAGRIRALIYTCASTSVHWKIPGRDSQGKLELFGTEAVLESCHIGRAGLRRRGVVVRGNDDIGGAVGDACLGCPHNHLDIRHLHLPQLSIRGRDCGID